MENIQPMALTIASNHSLSVQEPTQELNWVTDWVQDVVESRLRLYKPAKTRVYLTKEDGSVYIGVIYSSFVGEHAEVFQQGKWFREELKKADRKFKVSDFAAYGYSILQTGMYDY